MIIIPEQYNSSGEIFKHNNDSVYHFVFEVLRKMRPCGNGNNNVPRLNMQNIATLIESSDEFMAMKSIECLFDNFAFRSKLSNDIQSYTGLLLQNAEKTNKWIIPAKFLSAGSYGMTFSARLYDNPNIQFVGKLSLSKKTKLSSTPTMQITVEYFIGSAIINNFRRHCPFFCYTFGAFVCDTENPGLLLCSKSVTKSLDATTPPAIFYEFVDGINAHKIPSTKMAVMTIIQLLIALEIAQRESRFCHYDLSVNNVMITNKFRKFSVALDDKMFSFDFHMVKIIDYGFSFAEYKGRGISNNVGLLSTKQRRPCLVQGMDIFMFLLSLEEYNKDSTGDTSDYIHRIIKHFTDEKTSKLGDDYYGNIIPSKLASVAPMTVLEYILSDPESMKIIDDSLKITPRRVLESQPPQNVFKMYEEISDIKSKTVDSVDIDSFILFSNILYNAERTGVDRSDFLGLLKSKDVFIRNDKSMLEGYKLIDITDAVRSIDRIMQTNLKNYQSVPLSYLNAFISDCAYFDDIKAYIELYYLIFQLKLENIYDTFVREFPDSVAFKHYQMYHSTLTPARRWARTIIDYKDMDSKLYQYRI